MLRTSRALLLAGLVLTSTVAGQAPPSALLLPVDRAEFLPGARFDVWVELPGRGEMEGE